MRLLIKLLIAGGAVSAPAFTVTMTALSNATGTVTTQAYISPGGGGGTPSDLLDLLATLIAGGSVTGTGGITTATTGIASRTTGTAPLAVFFDATATTNSLSVDSFHDCAYFWHFGDDGAAMWAYGTGGGGYTKNQARGAVAAHCYETAGTKTAKVTPVHVSSAGTLSYGTTTEITITIDAADTTYSGTNTCYVANGTLPVAGANGVPVGATALYNYSSWASVVALMTVGKRVLLKRGDTWDASTQVYMSANGVTVGAYGLAGADPIVRTAAAGVTPFAMGNGVTDTTFMDLKITGTGGFTAKPISSNDTTGARTLMLRLEVTATGGPEVNGTGVFLVDCNEHELTGSSGYVGFWAATSDMVAVMGTRIYDCTGIEHNLRTQGSTRMVIQNNHLELCATNKSVLTIRGRSASSPNTSTTWSGVYVEKVIVSDNFIRSSAGTAWPVQFGPQNTGSAERLRDIIFERNYVDGNGNSNAAVMSEVCERFTARNNLILQSANQYAFFIGHRNAWIPEPQSSYIYNNTFHCTQAGVTAKLVVFTTDTGSDPSGTVIKNNLIYAPNASAGAVWGVYIGSGTATESNNSSPAQITGTSPGYTVPPTSTYTTWKPSTGYGVDAGAYVPVFEDFAGVARTGTNDLGAYQP